jgi:hypothetical protein
MVGAFGLTGNARADDGVIIQACGQGGCCNDRGCPHDGVCVPYTQTKKVEKRCYTDTCEQFCLPKCGSLLGGGLFGRGCGGDCDNGACHEGGCNQCCGPRTKKYLIVKIKQEEQCVPACKVEHGACGHGDCGAPAGTIQPAPAKQLPSAKPASAVRSNGQVQILEYRYMPMPNK